ncbi:MAG: SAM-dependent DNA methyltransferase [Bacteroidetes bacterium SB0662_bin_6]|nr:SAM-dependent DNA methyltransferase [Bacteroidetes bacterium SB0662_bin_6]
MTSADLTRLGSSNLPKKMNFQGHRGLDALTGKGNFDISEWMLLRALEWIEGREASLAILCKVAVVRRVLRHVWSHGYRLRNAEVRRIDADKHFGASVDACLFSVSGSLQRGEVECAVYDSLEAAAPSSRFGFRDGELVADLELYERWKHLSGLQRYRWRSGVKHDCSKVMELRRSGPDSYLNGFQEEVQLEPRFLFPMLKSSEVANGAVAEPTRWMLITQSAIGDDTSLIESEAPQTWKYLCAHGDRLDRRGSTIYQNRARFSVFGVGPYTFAPWRVAISGFYKKLDFRTVGSFEGKPIVLDDTCYFLPCGSRAEADCVHDLLRSEPAQELLGAFTFWDSKRPITVGLLSRLDLLAVAREVGADEGALASLGERSRAQDQLEFL